MNGQNFNSRNRASNGESSLFDARSIGAAQTVTPLDYHAQNNFADSNENRFRVIIKKSRSKSLDKTVFALSLLAVAILGCVAGTLLHFSSGNKSSETGSRYTSSADVQTATLLKQKAVTSRNNFAETAVRTEPLAVQPSVYAQAKPSEISYQVSPRTSQTTVVATSDNSENIVEPVGELSVGRDVAAEIKREMRRDFRKNKNTETVSSEIENAARMGREVRNWLERENK